MLSLTTFWGNIPNDVTADLYKVSAYQYTYFSARKEPTKKYNLKP